MARLNWTREAETWLRDISCISRKTIQRRRRVVEGIMSERKC